ncbi:MAG: polymerase III subunit gamma/tau protein [Microgenomates group bacterium GW2011_GWE1_47_12]|nr:MAG: polymerase III subunit gamma/tau protein [Microgenomates group bacterium GW2011_GWF2_46_18]KKU60267.1 MAG: polymerase III subunit gamma/tau protein [Microgenomates group bacterium GW2011_GWE1_47_12]
MSMSLYLKYRPRTIDELDLASVRKTLEQIVTANKVAHAYLLTGPRGAGKTSAARVLARIVNCEKNRNKLGEPCNECSACKSILNGSAVDFIEIDAASNRGIDDIRELKEKIRLAPSQLSYKVYIIDEVHMLTTEAFNALLKTLEEPPKHAIFALCTTETHKVPETIKSRCVPIQFGKASENEMKRSLSRVVAGEEKKISEEALSYLAKAVDGSFRDGVKALEIALTTTMEVDLGRMEEVVVGVAGFSAKPLAHALADKDADLALQVFRKAVLTGVNLGYLLVETMKALRDLLMEGKEVTLTKLIFALDEVASKSGTSAVPELLVEMVIIDWCGVVPKPSNFGEKNKDPKPTKIVPQSPKPEKKMAAVSHDEVWQKLLKGLNGDSLTLGALLSKATPAQISGDILTIKVGYAFHKEQIMTEKILGKLEKLLSEAMGREMKVKCEVAEAAAKMPAPSDTIDEAMAIFNS